MKTPLEVQFGLAQAWMSMWTRSSELSQEQQETWLRLSTEIVHHYVNERHTELHELQQTQDWQNLLMLLPGVAWRGVQNRMAVVQGAGQTMLTSQGALYSGWQAVLRDYVAANQAVLQNSVGSNGSNGASAPGGFPANTLANAMPAQLLQGWTDFVTQAIKGAGPAAAFAASAPEAESTRSKKK